MRARLRFGRPLFSDKCNQRCRLEKDKLRRRKLEDEVEELEENQREMQAHAEKLVAKKAADQLEIELLKMDNARKIAHKVAMKKQVALEDQELMRQTLETLERQERERAQKLLEFQVPFHHQVACKSRLLMLQSSVRSIHVL